MAFMKKMVHIENKYEPFYAVISYSLWYKVCYILHQYTPF